FSLCLPLATTDTYTLSLHDALPIFPWCDGRCVQGPGTYSPRHSDPRLLAIPTSWSRVADSNLDYDRLFEIRITSLCSCPLYLPRSEEHTSELQSRFDLVCRLLLEKK